MSTNGKTLPFAAPAGTPILGQPFTVTSVYIPIHMTLTCNCGCGETESPSLTITGSVAAACPNCGKVYNAAFNPQNGQIQMQIGQPQPEGQAS